MYLSGLPSHTAMPWNHDDAEATHVEPIACFDDRASAKIIGASLLGRVVADT